MCSLDTNGNWTNYYAGMQGRDISSVSVYNERIFVTANNELFYSDDGGDNFTRDENIFGTQIICTDSVFYLISAREFNMSFDEGATWQSYSDSLDGMFNPILRHLSISHDYFFLGSYFGGLYRSNADSIAWENIHSGYLYSTANIENVEAIDNSVIAGVYYWSNVLFLSNDYGNNFTDFDQYYNFAKLGQTYFLFKDSIYYSGDNGQSWNGIPFVENNSGCCIAKKGDTLIVGGQYNYYESALLMTTDEGQNWVDLKDDLPGSVNIGMHEIKNIAIKGNRLFVGNPAYGLWYRDDIITGSPDNQSKINTDKSILKIYPNPVANNCMLSIYLDQPSIVNISIYNSHGKKIKNTETRLYKGKHEISQDFSEYIPGVYYISLRSDNQYRSGKIIVIH